MIKKVSELTPKDKARYLENIKKNLESMGTPWEFYEKKIREEIDVTFDDELFSKMDPDMAIDAAYARQYFKLQKPEMVDYIIWMGTFVAKSEYVEIT